MKEKLNNCENTELTTEIFIREENWDVFINENFQYGHGGFEWKVLDFPKYGYRKVYVTMVNMEKYFYETLSRCEKLELFKLEAIERLECRCIKESSIICDNCLFIDKRHFKGCGGEK